ncbi:hypothetical protein PILCRDRAFT_4636 [Piloderma croceum F 1598]|uniref:Uncharacterized protein n=1 Tax=Piloderma croceum (strain F 1598) TaxID=765440 RepID=A0A0C3CAM3_PILCF|nr:hypothetical protein PILCRDRAFT_4636 [Piloderma croceum F 1598]
MVEEGFIKLGLETVFKTAREYENGHWLFTLQAGYFSQAHLDADNLSSQSPNGHKHTPKLLQASWNEDNGEAGDHDWSKVQGWGGREEG